MKKFNTVFLYNTKGDVTVYDNKEQAFKELGFNFISFHVGKELRVPGKLFSHFIYPKHVKTNTDFFNKHYPNSRQLHHADHILLNEFGEVLAIDDFEDVIISERKKNDEKGFYTKYRRIEGWNGTGPVPGTGGWGNGHYFRHPVTLQALKAACGVCKEDGEPSMRGNRTKSHVPSSWDDIHRSDRGIRNWKKYRKQQWKQKMNASNTAG